MKKRFILLMLLPTIYLMANTDSFYNRIYSLKNHNTTTIPAQPKTGYRYINREREVNVPRTLNRVEKVGITQLDAKKFFYANRAAQRGNPKAQFDLAIMYATGRGVQRNERMAFNWFHKSARNNYAPAKHYMGLSFLQGRGVRKQTELARYWFRLAAKQGYRASISYLTKIDQSLANRV
jgi:TPR repeat protein